MGNEMFKLSMNALLASTVSPTMKGTGGGNTLGKGHVSPQGVAWMCGRYPIEVTNMVLYIAELRRLPLSLPDHTCPGREFERV
jgi:hypothetical protein